MAEIWLHANRRVYLVPIAAAVLVALACLPGALLPISGGPWWIGVAAGSLVAVGLWIYSRRAARIAFDGRSLVLHIRPPRPIVVPIELIEAFLIGKGPTFLSGKDDYKTEASTLILRIAERSEEFRKVDTDVRLAAWCGHYVTFRGTWTEPLSVDLVNRLNQRLHEVQQAAKTPAQVAT